MTGDRSNDLEDDDASTGREDDDVTPDRGDNGESTNLEGDGGSRREESPGRGTPPDTDAPAVEEGRYVYCLVLADEDEAFEATGVEDEPVSLVTADGIGAVVHACEGLYDSDDMTTVHRWLVRHQSVIDEAADAFGTPLPFQFDTIVRGGDEAVREWLRDEREEITRALESLSGHWEYRIEVVRTEPIPPETLAEADDELADLRERIDAADEGTAFMLEKQLERRVSERRARRREELTADLVARLADRAREVYELERSPAAAVASETVDAGGRRAEDGETLCRLAVLAHEDDEDAVGSILDDVATADGIEVRFTGPWPPYTFAPEIGSDEETPSPTGSR